MKENFNPHLQCMDLLHCPLSLNLVWRMFSSPSISCLSSFTAIKGSPSALLLTSTLRAAEVLLTCVSSCKNYFVIRLTLLAPMPTLVDEILLRPSRGILPVEMLRILPNVFSNDFLC